MFNVAKPTCIDTVCADITFTGFTSPTPTKPIPPRVIVQDFSNIRRSPHDCAQAFAQHFFPEDIPDFTSSITECRDHLIDALCSPNYYTLMKLACTDGRLHLHFHNISDLSKSVSASAAGRDLLEDRSSALGLTLRCPGRANQKLTIRPFGEVLKVEYLNPLIPYTCQLYPSSLLSKQFWQLMYEEFSL